MSISNLKRRQFLQSALCGGLLYGSGSLPRLISSASAAPLQNRVLCDLYMGGGPDCRHLIVPAYDAAPDSFGNKYWKHRWRAHNINSNPSSWQARWNNDYYPITVGGQNWSSNLVDVDAKNNGVTFGIWKEAGWLIDMFRAGHVALVFNVVGGTNRAHDLATLMLQQGNLLSGLNDRDRSGWGGRLARSAGGNSLSLTNTPTPFSFGPLGAAPGYDANAIDNSSLLSIGNAREIGLFEFDLAVNQKYSNNQKMARAASSYYAGLRQEAVSQTFEKFMDHEAKLREFGQLIRGRLASPEAATPVLIQALMRGVNGINPAPGSSDARPVLRSSYSFGRQISNLYDVIFANDLLDARVMSLFYGGWDSHAEQRRLPNGVASDPNNPGLNRGIESGFRDIFGGKYGANPSDPNALHCGFSALWESLPNQADRDKMVITVSGEFGRQIRDNGDAGTDHGKGNLMMVISENCNGGVYGDMFQDAEVDKYDNTALNTPDIDPLTEIDPLFAAVSNWVQPNSGSSVFPRMSSGYSGTAPIIESAGMFNSLFS